MCKHGGSQCDRMEDMSICNQLLSWSQVFSGYAWGEGWTGCSVLRWVITCLRRGQQSLCDSSLSVFLTSFPLPSLRTLQAVWSRKKWRGIPGTSALCEYRENAHAKGNEASEP